MSVPRVRFWLPALAGLALLLMGLGTNAVPADAAVTNSSIHLMLTRDGYNRIQTTSPQTVYKLQYWGGPVMHTLAAYTIFWEPSGHSIPAGYQSLINRYFQDIGGSSFYKIVTQYYQNPGTKHIANQSTLAGTWADTVNAYPHAGTGSHPLTDADIRGEVNRAITANGWPTGLKAQYFVFTAVGIESCQTDNANCSASDPGTPGTFTPAYCAYHGHYKSGGKQIIYANMPYDASWNVCTGVSVFPNGNDDADIEISTTSHEHFEAVTDPLVTGFGPPTAWASPAADHGGQEIGDKCAYKYGAVNPDGSNITLNGHPYTIQMEWSNAAKNNKGGCAKKF